MPLGSWLLWAVLFAGFTALTAIFAKIGCRKRQRRFGDASAHAGHHHGAGGDRGWHRSMAAARVDHRPDLLFLSLSGLATGASWLCYFRALKLGDAALVAPIDKLSVVLVAVFGVTVLGERLSAMNWVGIGFIAAGAILVAYRG
jgi:transporter family protein